MGSKVPSAVGAFLLDPCSWLGYVFSPRALLSSCMCDCFLILRCSLNFKFALLSPVCRVTII